MKGHKLADKFDEHNELAMYWTDGKSVYFRHYEIKGADIETFEQFAGSWAKDKKHCYSGSTRLQNADAASFEVLNFTYAKDCTNVWTLGGRIPDADAATFEVCGSGRHSLGKSFKRTPEGIQWYELFVPYGFGKDKNNVYYYDFNGKPNVVKKAISASFASVDERFGYDDKNVFCGCAALPKANPKSWKKLMDNYYYSIDGNRVYYFNRLIKDADAETFKVVVVPVCTRLPRQFARDKNQGYSNDTPVELAKFEKEVTEKIEYEKQMAVNLNVAL